MIWVLVPLTPELSDGCNTLVGACPVTAGQTLTQFATIPVPSNIRGGIPAQLKIKMAHAYELFCTCFLINVIIN